MPEQDYVIEMRDDGSVISYFGPDFTPASKEEATLVKIVYPDGRCVFAVPTKETQ